MSPPPSPPKKTLKDQRNCALTVSTLSVGWGERVGTYSVSSARIQFRVCYKVFELYNCPKTWVHDCKKKCTFYLSVIVFSTKVLIGDTIFTSPNGDGTAILRGHPSHAKVSPPAVQRKYLHFSVILRPRVMVRPRESIPRPPALQSNALPTELILPRWSCRCCSVQQQQLYSNLPVQLYKKGQCF